MKIKENLKSVKNLSPHHLLLPVLKIAYPYGSPFFFQLLLPSDYHPNGHPLNQHR